MSVFLIYVEKGHKMARPIETREEYLALRNSPEQIDNVSKARDADIFAKSNLVQMNYSCLPNEDGTLAKTTRISSTIGMDVDHFKASEMEEVKNRILAKKDELGLLMLEKSARGAGYHFVFKRKFTDLAANTKEAILDNQVKNLRWASDLLGVEFDDRAKDHTHVFFTTTASDEDLIYLDDAIFSLTPNPSPIGEGSEMQIEQTSVASDAQQNSSSDESGLPASPCTYPENYLLPSPIGEGQGGEAGIPYPSIVAQLEKQLGGAPAHGSRNSFIFAMACNLRYICNHDPLWVAKVLPNYGEGTEKWMNTIRSACNRSMNMTMPAPMEKAIEMAKAKIKDEEDEEEDVDGTGTLGAEAPKMPKRLPAIIKLLLKNTPDIYKPAVANAIFPPMATHLFDTRFRYVDNTEREARLASVVMAGTGAGKSCVNEPINHIMKDIRDRDNANLERLDEWAKECNRRGDGSEKPDRPEDCIIQEIDANVTNAAFVDRTAEAKKHFLYLTVNEIDQMNNLSIGAGRNQQFQIMCLAFDPKNIYGQTRVSSKAVNKRVCIRLNWNASTTIKKGRQYFGRVLTDGPISRISFATIPERPIGSDMPVYGIYDKQFDEELKPYIDRLNAARGLIECPKASTFARKLDKECKEVAVLFQDRVYENLTFRAIVIAWTKAMVLYVANGCKWDKTIEDFARWSMQYDLWCKMRFFGEAITKDESVAETPRRRGPRNLLSLLPDTFTFEQAMQIRKEHGKDSKGTIDMLGQWRRRGYVENVTDDPRGSYKKISA